MGGVEPGREGRGRARPRPHLFPRRLIRLGPPLPARLRLPTLIGLARTRGQGEGRGSIGAGCSRLLPGRRRPHGGAACGEPAAAGPAVRAPPLLPGPRLCWDPSQRQVGGRARPEHEVVASEGRG